jgi:hypothetical protein
MFIVRFSPVDVNADLAVVPYFGLDIGRFFAGADSPLPASDVMNMSLFSHDSIAMMR